ncbi:MAG: isoprenylcysteine carboxylmethyltransferase family protein [Hadesarchaea archaeon]|nr:isoprenylcysteine carboxylmethyltransferase family protein [Hadesarchaea archaeon]MDH5686183.1 isoprenylcysteine carboxylmethyltransferase family protein [Hadesarchaea archaeon]
MSLIPAFEIGLWNGWIFMLYLILSPLLIRLILKDAWKKVATARDMLLNKTEKKLATAISLLFYALFIYSIFLPLKLGTACFYAGFFIFLLGLIFNITAMVNFATTPLDKPVTKGVYRVSRNPMYLGMFLIFTGTGIACVSWIFLLSTIGSIILTRIFVISEERFCLKKYGDAYREYMNRTPRWISFM